MQSSKRLGRCRTVFSCWVLEARISSKKLHAYVCTTRLISHSRYSFIRNTLDTGGQTKKNCKPKTTKKKNNCANRVKAEAKTVNMKWMVWKVRRKKKFGAVTTNVMWANNMKIDERKSSERFEKQNSAYSE